MGDSPARNRHSLLFVDAKPVDEALLCQLVDGGFEVVISDSVQSANDRLLSRPFDVVITAHSLPDQSGVHFLEHVCRASPPTVRILLATIEDCREFADAVNAGWVHRCLFQPWSHDQLMQLLDSACRHFQLEKNHDEWDVELHRFIQELENNVKQRTAELENANRQLQQRNLILTRMALTDPLTGLPNRRAMDRLARNELVRRARYPSPVAVAIIDVDHFKGINSAHLLSGGDHALTWLGQMLSTSVRTVDTVGRVGGDEFMLVAPETDPDGAWILIERIRTAIASSRTNFAGAEMRVSVSIGMAVAPASTPGGYDALRHAAATALSEAKCQGRNRSVMKLLDGVRESTVPD